MYLIVWEFEPCAGREREFEDAYGSGGEWARFFARGEGHLGTELLAEGGEPPRYLTIDRWASAEAYQAFRSTHATEYREIDERLGRLTSRETRLGGFHTVPPRRGPRHRALPRDSPTRW